VLWKLYITYSLIIFRFLFLPDFDKIYYVKSTLINLKGRGFVSIGAEEAIVSNFLI